jgi:hypothetical protein
MSRSSKRGVDATGRKRGRRAALTVAAGSVLLVLALGSGAGAETASNTTVILGNTASQPDPSCPNLPCQAIGSVTGFQTNNGQTAQPFLIRHAGVIKAWTLTLAQPTNSQRSFFNGFFGTPPEARLSILRKVPNTSPPRYELRSQGAIKVLSPFLGQTVRFSSNISVERNDIVGISVPTWAPAFSQNLSSANVWRASREPGTCTNSTAIRQGEPQSKIGRRATYGCKYTTARLLYTATLVQTNG